MWGGLVGKSQRRVVSSVRVESCNARSAKEIQVLVGMDCKKGKPSARSGL